MRMKMKELIICAQFAKITNRARGGQAYFFNLAEIHGAFVSTLLLPLVGLSNARRASNLFAKNRNGCWLGGLKIRRGCGNLNYGRIGDKERLIRESGCN